LKVRIVHLSFSATYGAAQSLFSNCQRPFAFAEKTFPISNLLAFPQQLFIGIIAKQSFKCGYARKEGSNCPK